MKNGVLSNFTRSHISSDRMRSGYEISNFIDRLEGMFSTYGIPYSIKTDNGAQFISEEIESFFTDNADIDHRTSRRDKTAAFQKSSELNKKGAADRGAVKIPHGTSKHSSFYH